MAEKEDGKIIEGESNIPVLGEKIKRVFYKRISGSTKRESRSFGRC